MNYMDLSGTWTCEIPGQKKSIQLPGTLDESGIGFADDPHQQWKVDEVERIGFYHEGDPIVTRLTRKATFEGIARLEKTIDWAPDAGKRVFLCAERARDLQLLVNGKRVSPLYPGTLDTPYQFEITPYVTGHDTLTLLSSNAYLSWPREAIVYASAASDETQTNWNGILGTFCLNTEEPVFIDQIRAYPQDHSLDLVLVMNTAVPWEGDIMLRSDAFPAPVTHHLCLSCGLTEISLPNLPLVNDLHHWDLEDGFLYTLTAEGVGLAPYRTRFGLRTFRAEGTRLMLNGRPVFLRSEANCAVFPETGYCPMDVETWKEVLRTYQAYGVNCMRFHSHCPPEAAFTAADELGMLMQPELSHWDPVHAFASPKSQAYYTDELLGILRFLCNHPSLVMLTFGNELHADAAGHAFMSALLRKARAFDGTRLYANGSNPHYGALGPDRDSDFYTSQNCDAYPIRATSAGPSGWLNKTPPQSVTQYDDALHAIAEKATLPTFSFEVGQYEVLPDFAEIASFSGVTAPNNFLHIQRKVQEAGMMDTWSRQVEATGESALLGYRTEVEAAMRTRDLAGISLLGLQDFPGQGTALIGMMNTHLQPKPYSFADPARFRAFFRDTLPLLLLPRFVYTEGETLEADIQLFHYGKETLSGSVAWKIEGKAWTRQGTGIPVTAASGSLTHAGHICVPLPKTGESQALEITLSFHDSTHTYPLWVYPDITPHCPQEIYECRALDARAEAVLSSGGSVFLAPDSTPEALPHSIPAQFTTDFWSVCTFPQQSGSMGQLIDTQHPLFAHFPTKAYSTFQWWPMANTRAVILPHPMHCIIAEMDSYAFLRPMAKLMECHCGNGRVLFSSMGLHNLSAWPQARVLLQAIYDYMISDHFEPSERLPLDTLQALVLG